MKLIEQMPFGKNVLYKDGYYYKGIEQRIFFQKAIYPANNQIQYFFKLFIINQEKLCCQGYIYFYLNDILKTSDFIGVYVKDEYRNTGLASLLVASWIDFCLNNGYNYLGTNKKQRKPFLLYLLKIYGFEILDISNYETSKSVIHICQSNQDLKKYLLFENNRQKERFEHGKIYLEDNYQIIDKLSKDMVMLDKVILSAPYYMIDQNKGEKKSILTLKNHQR